MDSSLDPEAQAAIDELAGQLQPALRSVIDAAIREALDKLEDSFQRRREEIEAASGRFEEALNGLGSEMKAKAGLALREGIQEKVIPALEEESRKVVEQTSNAIGVRLESAERAVAGLEVTLSKSTGHVSEALEQNEKAATAALLAAQETISNTVKENGVSSMKATAAALANLEERMGALSSGSTEAVKKFITLETNRNTDAARTSFIAMQRELSGIAEQGATISTISGSGFSRLESQLGETAQVFTNQLRALGEQEDQRTKTLREEAEDRGRKLADQMLKDKEQIILAQSAAKKEIVDESKQASAATSKTLSSLQDDIGAYRDDVAQRVTLTAKQQRVLVVCNLLATVILILLSAIIIRILLHHRLF